MTNKGIIIITALALAFVPALATTPTTGRSIVLPDLVKGRQRYDALAAQLRTDAGDVAAALDQAAAAYKPNAAVTEPVVGGLETATRKLRHILDTTHDIGDNLIGLEGSVNTFGRTARAQANARAESAAQHAKNAARAKDALEATAKYYASYIRAGQPLPRDDWRNFQLLHAARMREELQQKIDLAAARMAAKKAERAEIVINNVEELRTQIDLLGGTAAQNLDVIPQIAEAMAGNVQLREFNKALGDLGGGLEGVSSAIEATGNSLGKLQNLLLQEDGPEPSMPAITSDPATLLAAYLPQQPAKEVSK